MIPIEYRLDKNDGDEYIKLVIKKMQYKYKVSEAIRKLWILIKQYTKSAANSAWALASNNSACKTGYLKQWLVIDFDDISLIKSTLDKILQDFVNKYVNNFISTNYTTIKCHMKNNAQITKYSELAWFYSENINSNNTKAVDNGLQKINDFLELTYNPFVYMQAYYCNHFSKENINNWIIDKTQMQVCPYCNISYTYNRGKNVTAQLDHFFPKSEYPVLALCFYNLVPVCPSCNRIKGQQTDEIMSPYGDNAFKNMRISWKYVLGTNGNNKYQNKYNLPDLEKNIKITIDSPEQKEEMGCNLMKLYDAYQNHKDYASELIKKIENYGNPDMKKLILAMGSANNMTNAEIDRFYFGNYMESSNANKRPLAKMTQDFWTEYKEITNNE